MPRKGDFGVAHTKNRMSWWVGLLQFLIGDASRWTHAFIVLDEHTALEAHRKLGVIKRPLTDYDNVVYSDYELTDEQRQLIVESAEEFLGSPYSWLSYVAIGLMHFGKCPNWMTRKIINSHAYICSQLVYLTYEKAGVELFGPDYSWINVTPGDLSYVLRK